MISARNREKTEEQIHFLANGDRRLSPGDKFQVSASGKFLCSLDKNKSWPEDTGLFGATLFDTGDVHDSIDDVFNRAAESINNTIVMDKRIYGGAPCVADTRVPVYAILELVEAGYSHKKILKSFPTISQRGLEAALQFATYVMEK